MLVYSVFQKSVISTKATKFDYLFRQRSMMTTMMTRKRKRKQVMKTLYAANKVIVRMLVPAPEILKHADGTMKCCKYY